MSTRHELYCISPQDGEVVRGPLTVRLVLSKPITITVE